MPGFLVGRKEPQSCATRFIFCALVKRAALVLDAVLTEAPRAEVPALILADAALAQALGWDHVVPLLAAGLKRTDLRKRGDDLRLACHRAVTASAVEAARLAVDLARRASLLKGVALPLPDRAARRLCDRLVDLGAVRELTGRDTFRLYGV